KVAVLASTIVLARLLAPTDFGVVAIALVFITYADVVTDLGVAQALVFLPPDRRRNDAALVVCLAVSGAFVAVAMLVAPLAASFFGHPEVTGMFRVLSAGGRHRAAAVPRLQHRLPHRGPAAWRPGAGLLRARVPDPRARHHQRLQRRLGGRLPALQPGPPGHDPVASRLPVRPARP